MCHVVDSIDFSYSLYLNTTKLTLVLCTDFYFFTHYRSPCTTVMNAFKGAVSFKALSCALI